MLIIVEYLLNFKNINEIYKKTALNTRIHNVLSKLPKYRPPFFLPGPYVKLIASQGTEKPVEATFHREIFEFEDGGKVGLDFFPRSEFNGEAKNLTDRGSESTKTTPLVTKKPFVIVIPGLAGYSQNPYIVRACEQFYSEYGFKSVVANRRGSGGVPISGKYPCTWVRNEDLDTIIEHLQAREDLKDSPMFMIGFSLGACFTHFYAGRKGELDQRVHLEGVVAVSPPYEMAIGYKRLKRFNYFDQYLLKGAQELFNSYRDNQHFLDHMEKVGVTKADVDESKTLYEFDDRVASKFFGRKNAEDYYEYYSANRRMEHVEVPFLSITSELDPILDGTCVDKKKVRENENIYYFGIRDAGHVAYPQGWGMSNYAVTVAGKWMQVLSQGREDGRERMHELN